MERTAVHLAAFFVLCAGMAVAPAAGAEPRLAVESITGTALALTPNVPWERAALRVVGPGGFELRQRFSAGSTPRLLLEGEDGSPLPDGRYKYELRLVTPAPGGGGTMRVQANAFFVEGGAVIPRQAKREELAGIRSELEAERRQAQQAPQSLTYIADDAIFIEDAAQDTETYLQLDANYYSGSLYTVWRVKNVGDLRLAAGESSIANLEDKLTLEWDTGRMGLGTTAPGTELHLYGELEEPLGAKQRIPQIRFDAYFFPSFCSPFPCTPQPEAVTWNLGADAGKFFLEDDTNNTVPLKIEANTPDDTLVLGPDGVRLGGGVSMPDFVFDPDFNLESIEEHAAYMWEHRHLPAVGPAQVVDGRTRINLMEHAAGVLEELEKAHIWIEQLNAELEAKDERIARLEAAERERATRIERLEARERAMLARLAALEEARGGGARPPDP